MNDLVIKGTGNSRLLKSVQNFMSLYPTYTDFVQALIDGTLPIDLNGFNSAGVQTQGTPLNKTNLLKDATANKYGLGGNATINDVLNQIPTGSFPNMTVGSATGATTAGTAINANNTDLTNATWTELPFGNDVEIRTQKATFEVQVTDNDAFWIAVPLLSVTADAMYFMTMGFKNGTQYCIVEYSRETDVLKVYSTNTWTPTRWRYRIIS